MRPTNKSKPKSAAGAPRARTRRSRTQAQGKPLMRPSNSAGARTTDQVQRALASMVVTSTNKEQANAWTACRLSPWGSNAMAALLPDGSGDPRTVVDHYAYTDITIKEGQKADFTIATLPTLPYNAALRVTTDSTVTVSGSNMIPQPPTDGGAYNLEFTGSSAAPCWVPINFTKAAILTNYNDNPTGVANRVYIAADKARITSMGWRLIYTGPANACTGIVTVSSSPVRSDDPIDKSGGRITTFNASGGALTNINTGTNGVKVIPIRLKQLLGTTGKDSISARPEVTLKGLVRHSAPIYNWCDLQEQYSLMVNADSGVNLVTGDVVATMASAQGPSGILADQSTVLYGTINLIDDSWDSTLLQVSGVVGSYRFETWQCVEYIPITESAFYDTAKKVSVANTQIIDQANKQAAQKPIAEKGTA